MPADVRAALHWLAIRRPRPWAAQPEPKEDIAAIIAARRQQVAAGTARDAGEERQGFAAAVTPEVERRSASP